MNKFQHILSLCKCGVYLSVNNHRDYYESVEKYLEDRNDEVDVDVKKKMIETDTIVEIQFYPNTPIGFYRVYHHNLDGALDAAIRILEAS
jgi:ribosome-associated translation inhibitor RaiA